MMYFYIQDEIPLYWFLNQTPIHLPVRENYCTSKIADIIGKRKLDIFGYVHIKVSNGIKETLKR